MRLEIGEGQLTLSPETDAERCQLWVLKTQAEASRIEHRAKVQWQEISMGFPLKIIVGQ